MADADAESLNNLQEWRCGTCPTNCLSALRLLSALPHGTNVTVSWESVAGLIYSLERSTNLGSPFTLLATGIPGQAGTTIHADTNAAGPGPLFYRVGVNPPLGTARSRRRQTHAVIPGKIFGPNGPETSH